MIKESMSDPGEESFSLSSFDFNSSFKLDSSDEDGDNDDDADTYIEFEVQPATTMLPDKLESSMYSYDKEFEFRILVPTFVPFPGFAPDHNISPAKSLLSNVSIVGNGGEFAKGDDGNSASPPPMAGEGSKSGGAIGNCSGPLLRIFWNLGPRRSFSMSIKDGDDNGDGGYDLDLERSSKASRKILSTENRGVMELLRSVIISMQMKSSPISRRRWRISDLMKPINKWFTDLQLMMIKRSNGCRAPQKSTTPHLLFISDKQVERIAQSQSCPTSVKSSPAHDLPDSSVCAAIAHCKRSLGHADDFCF